MSLISSKDRDILHVDGDVEPVVGKRQQGIAERGRRLVRAAGELILESEDGAFSMPQLARRAGLSLATPYNLFGSKAAVLSALFETQVRGFYRDDSWMAGKTPLDKILGMVDRLTDAYVRQPKFFRNLRKALSSLGPIEQGQFPQPTNGHLVQPLLRSLENEDVAFGKPGLEIVEQTLMRIFNGVFEEWALQDWPTDRFRDELRIGFCLVLQGFLSTEEQQKIRTVLAKR